MIRRTFVTFASAAALSSAVAVTTFANASGNSMDIVDTAINAGSFTTLVAAVQAAGLVDTLKGRRRLPRRRDGPPRQRWPGPPGSPAMGARGERDSRPAGSACR